MGLLNVYLPNPCFLKILYNKLSFENDFGDGMLAGVRHGEMRGRCAGLFVKLAHAATKNQYGSAAAIARADLYVLPCDAARPTCSESLERGFLGGKSRGIMLGRDRATALAVSALALSINALSETRRAQQDFTHARDFDNVYTDRDDHSR